VFADHFEALVFDFDGTLVESNQIKRRLFYEVAEYIEGSKDCLDSIILDNPDWTRVEIFNELTGRLCGKKQSTQEAERLLTRYSERALEEVACAPEVDGASELLRKLSLKEKDVYISSATPHDALVELVDRRSLGEFVRDCFGAPEQKKQHLSTIREMSGCNSSKILCVGDADGDEAVALAAGCEFIRVMPFRGKCMGDIKRCVSDMRELGDLLFQ